MAGPYARGMKKRLGLATIAGAIAVLPFAALELVNRRSFDEGLPFVLFGLLWVLAAAFVGILATVVRHRRAWGLIAGIAALIAIAWVWGSIVADQMPCFLGVPNCD